MTTNDKPARCYAKATLRQSGNKCVTVPVAFSLDLHSALVAYLVAKEAHYDNSAFDGGDVFSTIPVPATKGEVFAAMQSTLRSHGTDYWSRSEDFADGWETAAKTVAVRDAIATLFGF